ncbi:MAG: hypothetical protein ACTSRZ_15010 [Promethearchaeota archaeon]
MKISKILLKFHYHNHKYHISLIIIFCILYGITMDSRIVSIGVVKNNQRNIINNPIAATSQKQIFFDDFHNQSSVAYPAGWICFDNRPLNVIVEINYNYFDPGINLMDHQNSFAGITYKDISENVVNGTFEFLFYFVDYDSGANTFDFFAYLKNNSGNNVIDIKFSQSKDGNYFTVSVMGNVGTTHFNVNTIYKIKVIFNANKINLWVNSTLEHKNVSYNPSPISRIYFETSVLSYGTTAAIDNITLNKIINIEPADLYS